MQASHDAPSGLRKAVSDSAGKIRNVLVFS